MICIIDLHWEKPCLCCRFATKGTLYYYGMESWTGVMEWSCGVESDFGVL